MAHRGSDFGIAIDGNITINMKQVKARKDSIVQQSNTGVTNWLKNMDNLTVYEGHARMEDANTVRVNGDLLKSDKIIINVGGRPVVPDIPGINEVNYMTSFQHHGCGFSARTSHHHWWQLHRT